MHIDSDQIIKRVTICFVNDLQYLRSFDESVNYIELDYPRNISMFAGIGTDIDAVFQWKNGQKNIFLQGERLLGVRRPKDEGCARKAKAVSSSLDGLPSRTGNERRRKLSKEENNAFEQRIDKIEPFPWDILYSIL
ncbi:hypothetical protein E2986_13839 [Frieseomelitta varia]|uniref:Uncharacterized protein n=1 Tax=Frieseomelitta varia TaxID=561572 RepID=A0A833VUV5_9HYME|nr:hypothetical protein E2986_13839 [Frieseomelitta varia]